jgi:hypothetical protein
MHGCMRGWDNGMNGIMVKRLYVRKENSPAQEVRAAVPMTRASVQEARAPARIVCVPARGSRASAPVIRALAQRACAHALEAREHA